jgi:hypothetical protein
VAKERTDKSRWPSRYSPNGFVTGAQFLVEVVCQNKAKRDSVDLPIKFWELPDWKNYFRWQSKMANELVKEFGEEAVISALKDKRGSYIYSLNAPKVKVLAAEYKKKIEARPVPKVVEVIEDINTAERPPIQGEKSILGKLD